MKGILMRYRKKSVIVEAILWDEKDETADQIADLIDQNVIVVGNRYIEFETLSGLMIANPGDYIIKEVEGECYPCKPDIFAQTYEPVE